jgi:hypothetical protein
MSNGDVDPIIIQEKSVDKYVRNFVYHGPFNVRLFYCSRHKLKAKVTSGTAKSLVDSRS